MNVPCYKVNSYNKAYIEILYMNDALELAKQLIRQASITPDDAECQKIIAEFLRRLGFRIEHLPFADVKNLWAVYGTRSPLLVFAGHTDVVPPGPLQNWTHPPFTPTVQQGKLYGRGSADMKGAIAAMLAAVERFLATASHFNGSIAFLITSDEEGPGIHGTRAVVEYLKAKNIRIQHCLVGEASSENILGDTLKIGRRGSLSARLTLYGQQGHIAYPHLALNPIHLGLPLLQTLTDLSWGTGHPDFPATSLQISNIHAGTGAGNVIPGEMTIDFNLRYSPDITAEQMKAKVMEVLQESELSYQIDWAHSGKPFVSRPGKLVAALETAIAASLSCQPKYSTSGGTSDGRFLIDIAEEVIEFGPVNASIHQVNEHIRVDDLYTLSQIYEDCLKHLLLPNAE